MLAHGGRNSLELCSLFIELMKLLLKQCKGLNKLLALYCEDISPNSVQESMS